MYTSEIRKKSKVLIVYATTSGNSEMVAEAIADGINQSDHAIEAECVRAEVTKPSELNKFSASILIASTWNVGLLNDNMVPFNKDLLSMKMDGKLIDVVGLGDSKNYDIYNGAADILENTVKKVGASQVMPTLKIDGEVFSRLEEYKAWGKIYAEKLVKKLSSNTLSE